MKFLDFVDCTLTILGFCSIANGFVLGEPLWIIAGCSLLYISGK